MHAICMSLALMPGSGPVMYGVQHIQVLHTSVTLSGASGVGAVVAAVVAAAATASAGVSAVREGPVSMAGDAGGVAGSAVGMGSAGRVAGAQWRAQWGGRPCEQRQRWTTATSNGAKRGRGKAGGQRRHERGNSEGRGGGRGAAAGEVDTALGWQWGRSTPGEVGARGHGGGGGGDAELAAADIPTHTLAEMHTGHIITGHRWVQAVREGLPCCPSAPAASRL